MPSGINLGRKVHEFIYSFNTNDRYADYSAKPTNKKHSAQRSKADSYQSSGKDQRSSQFTSPILDYSFNAPDLALTGDFDTHNEGVSETILAWRHIELWTRKHHTDLNETLNPPVTRNDISNAENDLNVEFPPSMVTSLRIHDGQDFSGSFKDYCGLFFTLELMLLDKIVEMTRTWRKVSDKLNGQILQKKLNHDVLLDLKSPELTYENDFHETLHKSGKRDGEYQQVETFNFEVNPNLEDDLKRKHDTHRIGQRAASGLRKQSLIPANTVHGVYAHRDWIPVITDNAGNHVAVDLSPAVNGVYGQVILFGREFDTKYVVASTWGDFLLNFAKDLESGNYIIRSEETFDDIMAGDGELSYWDKESKIEKSYFDVLKDRAIESFESRKSQSTKLPQLAAQPANVNASYTYDGSQLLDINESKTYNGPPEMSESKVSLEPLSKEYSRGSSTTETYIDAESGKIDKQVVDLESLQEKFDNVAI